MSMHDFISNDYVQLAVIFSGLLTLLMLAIQGYRILVKPLISLAKNGISRSSELRRQAFDNEVNAAAADGDDLHISTSIRLIQISMALANLIIAGIATIVSAIMFVPSYGGDGVTLITLGMSPRTAAITGAIVSFVALAFFFTTIVGAMFFMRAVQRKRRASRK